MANKLDLVFLLDCTSSMGSYITNAKKNITKIYEEIIRAEKCHLRIALIEYEDHKPQSMRFLTRVADFTDDIAKAKKAIDNASAVGGGDFPESICCALHDCLHKLEWRDDAIKISILIADAPPHGLYGVPGDTMPNGCPDGNDPIEIAHKMAEKAITLYCVGCEPSATPYRNFFQTAALITGGQYVPLDKADDLTPVIIGGAREEVSMEKLMADVHAEVIKEAEEKGEGFNEELLTRRIHEVLNLKGAKVNKLKTDTDIVISNDVKEMAKLKTLKEINEYMKTYNVKTVNNTFSTPCLFASSATSSFTGFGLGKKRPILKARRRLIGRAAEPRSLPVPKPAAVTITTTVHTIKKPKTTIKTKPIRRSARLNALKIDDVDKEESMETETDDMAANMVLRSATKPKLEKKTSSVSVSNDENIDIEQTRRLVKKSIARNKLRK